MGNIYPEQNKDRPAKKSDAETSQKTMGVYDRPKRKGPSKALIITIVLAMVILAWILLAGFTGAAQAGSLRGAEAEDAIETVVQMAGFLP